MGNFDSVLAIITEMMLGERVTIDDMKTLFLSY